MVTNAVKNNTFNMSETTSVSRADHIKDTRPEHLTCISHRKSPPTPLPLPYDPHRFPTDTDPTTVHPQHSGTSQSFLDFRQREGPPLAIAMPLLASLPPIAASRAVHVHTSTKRPATTEVTVEEQRPNAPAVFPHLGNFRTSNSCHAGCHNMSLPPTVLI